MFNFELVQKKQDFDLGAELSGMIDEHTPCPVGDPIEIEMDEVDWGDESDAETQAALQRNRRGPGLHSPLQHHRCHCKYPPIVYHPSQPLHRGSLAHFHALAAVAW